MGTVAERNFVIPAKAGTQICFGWASAFAGVTKS